MSEPLDWAMLRSTLERDAPELFERHWELELEITAIDQRHWASVEAVKSQLDRCHCVSDFALSIAVAVVAWGPSVPPPDGVFAQVCTSASDFARTRGYPEDGLRNDGLPAWALAWEPAVLVGSGAGRRVRTTGPWAQLWSPSIALVGEFLRRSAHAASEALFDQGSLVWCGPADQEAKEVWAHHVTDLVILGDCRCGRGRDAPDHNPPWLARATPEAYRKDAQRRQEWCRQWHHVATWPLSPAQRLNVLARQAIAGAPRPGGIASREFRNSSLCRVLRHNAPEVYPIEAGVPYGEWECTNGHPTHMRRRSCHTCDMSFDETADRVFSDDGRSLIVNWGLWRPEVFWKCRGDRCGTLVDARHDRCPRCGRVRPPKQRRNLWVRVVWDKLVVRKQVPAARSPEDAVITKQEEDASVQACKNATGRTPEEWQDAIAENPEMAKELQNHPFFLRAFKASGDHD
jgi:hypothetical protein